MADLQRALAGRDGEQNGPQVVGALQPYGDLVGEDRADRLGITVSQTEVNDAVKRLKDQYGITTDAQFAESLQSSGMTRPEMEARLRDTILTNKVFSKELKPREDLSDRELREERVHFLAA